MTGSPLPTLGPAAVDAHRVGELLLDLPVACYQMAEQAEVSGLQAQRYGRCTVEIS